MMPLSHLLTLTCTTTRVLLRLQMFRRKKWKYLILDEAHMIKNWKSQRWQTLLRFNSKRRLLITGTPLQVRYAVLWVRRMRCPQSHAATAGGVAFIVVMPRPTALTATQPITMLLLHCFNGGPVAVSATLLS
jgi:hypothetical protein